MMLAEQTPASRRADVLAVLDEIRDPCSVAAGHAFGLVSMGLVEQVSVRSGHVDLRIMPTFAGCLYLGMFEEEARRRLSELEWCESVSVERVPVAEGLWSEERMSPAARAELERRRAFHRPA